MDSPVNAICFEQPLNERVRSLLRLEFLFDEFQHHAKDRSAWGIRSSLRTLLDILSVIGRTDLRTELIRDLSEQRNLLDRLRSGTGIDPVRLDTTLGEISAALTALYGSSAHPSAIVRDNEFLFAILNRSSIPGGTCDFDLPAYHRWLARSQADTSADLARWFAPLTAYRQAVTLYLRLLRESRSGVPHVAYGGVCLYVPQGIYALLRVLIAPDIDVYPEISAGKHRFSFRFMRAGPAGTRNVQTSEDVPFLLQCCVLGN